MFRFLYNYFTMEYIILYYISRYATYKFCSGRNKSREMHLNFARGGCKSKKAGLGDIF